MTGLITIDFDYRKNSSNTWQAMIHEDLLLSRIDILENKLSCYQKNITNEKLQEQINQLQDEKEVYQVSWIVLCFLLVVQNENCNQFTSNLFHRKPLKKP